MINTYIHDASSKEVLAWTRLPGIPVQGHIIHFNGKSGGVLEAVVERVIHNCYGGDSRESPSLSVMVTVSHNGLKD
jgi:hypothetical protein